MYGAAHECDKSDFNSEFADFCCHVQTLLLIGGDFNILGHCGKKNVGINLFNSIINTMCLNEIYMSGGVHLVQ